MPKAISLVYLSGPMTGYPGFNYDTFMAAAGLLRANGIDVINPAETAGGVTHLPRATFMRIDIGYVMAADAIVLLPGWEQSSGAKLELMVAQALGLEAYEYDGQGGLGNRIKNISFRVTYDTVPAQSRPGNALPAAARSPGGCAA